MKRLLAVQEHASDMIKHLKEIYASLEMGHTGIPSMLMLAEHQLLKYEHQTLIKFSTSPSTNHEMVRIDYPKSSNAVPQSNSPLRLSERDYGFPMVARVAVNICIKK
jgi:hypothetical protein